MQEQCPRLVKGTECGGTLKQVSRIKTFSTITDGKAQCVFKDRFFCTRCGGTVHREWVWIYEGEDP